MADVGPNYRLERKKIEVQIGQLQQNLLAQELREMQLESDLEAVQKTMEATELAIADQQTLLASLTTE